MTRKISMPVDDHGVAVQDALFPSATIVLDLNAVSHNLTAMVNQVVRLVATQNCHIKFGNVTVIATVNDMFLPKSLPEYFSMRGDQYISAVIDNIADLPGSLNIVTME
jgi:hypothetical protein